MLTRNNFQNAENKAMQRAGSAVLGAHMDEAVVGVADVEVGVEEVEEAWKFDP